MATWSGVEAPLAVEAEDLAAPGVVAEALRIPHLHVRPVDHLQTVGPACHEDLHEHVVEVVARVLRGPLEVFVAAAGGAEEAFVSIRRPDADSCVSAGGFSPGRTIHAIVWPTGMTSPSCAFTPVRIPSAGDSISTTALSVSISRSGSPLATPSPSFFRQARTLPFSCAISRAGITMLWAMMFGNGEGARRYF